MKKLISFLIAIVFTNLLFKVNAQTNDIIFPKVSVIIPVYNTEKYLNDCLDCILGQSLIDTEIICVNDGSTDNSLEILNEYKDKDCRVKIINTENVVSSTCLTDIICLMIKIPPMVPVGV